MTTLAKSYDAIVAGAGPAGGFAACLLAREGRRVLLADKARFPREKVCGCCLNGKAVTLLRGHGIQITANDGAVPIREIEFRHRTSFMVKPVVGGLILPRSILDQRIVEEAVSQGAHFVDDCRVSVTLRGPESLTVECGSNQVQTKLLIEASGLAGRVEEELVSETTSPNSYLGAASSHHNPGCDLPLGRIAMHVGDGGYVGLVRFADGVIHAAAALSPALVKESAGIAGAVRTILSSCGVRLLEPFRNEEWRGTPFLTRQRSNFSVWRQFTIGDAAGYVEPFTGEGMAWALQSAQDVFPFALEEWNEALATRWNRSAQNLQRRRQRMCRGVSYLLRRPALVNTAIRADAFLSPLYAKIVWSMASAPVREAVRAAP